MESELKLFNADVSNEPEFSTAHHALRELELSKNQNASDLKGGLEPVDEDVKESHIPLQVKVKGVIHQNSPHSLGNFKQIPCQIEPFSSVMPTPFPISTPDILKPPGYGFSGLRHDGLYNDTEQVRGENQIEGSISKTDILERHPHPPKMTLTSHSALRTSEGDPSFMVTGLALEPQKGASCLSIPHKQKQIDLDDIEFANSAQILQKNVSHKPKEKKIKVGGLRRPIKETPIRNLKLVSPNQEYITSSNRAYSLIMKARSSITFLRSIFPAYSASCVWMNSVISRVFSAGRIVSESFRKYRERSHGSLFIKRKTNLPPKNDMSDNMTGTIENLSKQDILQQSGHEVIFEKIGKKKRRGKPKIGEETESGSLDLINSMSDNSVKDSVILNNDGSKSIEVSWEKQGLELSFMHALNDLMQINEKSKWLRIEVTKKSYQILGYHHQIGTHKGFSWLKSRSRVSANEFERRRRVLCFQLLQYDIVNKWEKLKHGINENLQRKIQRCLHIDQLWPTFCDITQMDSDLYKSEIEEITGTNRSVAQMLQELMGMEFVARPFLLMTVLQRQSEPKWWDDNELRDARRQGIDVGELIFMGDTLNFGRNGFDHNFILMSHLALDTATHIFGHIDNRVIRADVTGYPLMESNWDKSAEKAWFTRNNQLYSLWKSRMKMVILGSSGSQFASYASMLRDLGFSQTQWWSLGDLLKWIDEGIPVKAVTRIGIKLKLKKTSDLTLEKVESANWRNLLSGLDENIGQKIQKYFQEQILWNIEIVRLKNPNLWQSFKTKLQPISHPTWKKWPEFRWTDEDCGTTSPLRNAWSVYQ